MMHERLRYKGAIMISNEHHKKYNLVHGLVHDSSELLWNTKMYKLLCAIDMHPKAYYITTCNRSVYNNTSNKSVCV